MSISMANYPDLLKDLADQIAGRLMAAGIDKEKADAIGFSIAEHVRENWSGQSLYLPKGVLYTLTKRDLEIFDRFNGRNHLALAREYNLTVIRIYQIIKTVRAELLKQRQGALF